MRSMGKISDDHLTGMPSKPCLVTKANLKRTLRAQGNRHAFDGENR